MRRFSDEKKVRIATHSCSLAPPGEVFELMGDVKKLLPDTLLTSTVVENVLMTYNKDQMVVAKTPSGMITRQ